MRMIASWDPRSCGLICMYHGVLENMEVISEIID